VHGEVWVIVLACTDSQHSYTTTHLLLPVVPLELKRIDLYAQRRLQLVEQVFLLVFLLPLGVACRAGLLLDGG
jgi:hypothetical protein